MHNVEINEPGLVAGWVSGAPNGAPGRIKVAVPPSDFIIAATGDRPDVLHAGYTRFSGFRLRITSPPGIGPIQFEIESTLYIVTPAVLQDSELLCVDRMTADCTEGWLNTDAPLTSLVFSDGHEMLYPDLVLRPDIIAHKSAGSLDRFGFTLGSAGFETPRFCLINGAHLHVFATALGQERNAA